MLSQPANAMCFVRSNDIFPDFPRYHLTYFRDVFVLCNKFAFICPVFGWYMPVIDLLLPSVSLCSLLVDPSHIAVPRSPRLVSVVKVCLMCVTRVIGTIKVDSQNGWPEGRITGKSEANERIKLTRISTCFWSSLSILLVSSFYFELHVIFVCYANSVLTLIPKYSNALRSGYISVRHPSPLPSRGRLSLFFLFPLFIQNS